MDPSLQYCTVLTVLTVCSMYWYLLYLLYFDDRRSFLKRRQQEWTLHVFIPRAGFWNMVWILYVLSIQYIQIWIYFRALLEIEIFHGWNNSVTSSSIRYDTSYRILVLVCRRYLAGTTTCEATHTERVNNEWSIWMTATDRRELQRRRR